MLKSFILAAICAANFAFAQVSSIPSASSGGASTFDAIGSGTNTTATMTCGAGCTLVTTAGVFRLPNGTSAPGTCTGGDVFFDTDATAGLNFYGCTATDTWTLLSGSGSGASAVTDLTDCKLSATTSVVTIAECKVIVQGSDGRLVSTTLPSATNTRSGSESGTSRYYVDPNGGSPQLVCMYDSGTMTAGNYTPLNCTETGGTDFPVGAWPIGTVVITSGTWQTPTDLRALPQIYTYGCGDGLVPNGNKCDVNDAAVGFLATASTWTAKQQFTPTASVAGAQLVCAALPSSPVNGDIACDSGDSNKIKLRSNGAWVDPSSSGGTPGGSTTQVQFNSSGAFAGDAGLTWDNTNKLLQIVRSNGSSTGGQLYVGNTGSAGAGDYAGVTVYIDNNTQQSITMARRQANLDGTGNAGWSTLTALAGSGDVNNIISRKSGELHIGGVAGSFSGYTTITSAGASRFADAATAGRGLVSIQGSPSALTSQTGDLSASDVLATGHTAGLYRVCVVVSITAAGTGSTGAWTLTWRSPASGTNLSHSLLWSSGGAETDTFSVAAANEYNVCKVIQSTGANAISLNPGDMNTATFNVYRTVERLQ